MADLTHPEAERAVLGALLIAGAELLAEIGADLAPADFWEHRNRLIFDAMIAAAAEKLPVDVRTVQAELERRGNLAAAGGIVYLSALDLDLPDLSRAHAYARIVRDAAIRRRLLADIRTAGQRLGTEGAPIAEVVSELHLAIRETDRAIAVDELHMMADSLDTVMERLEHPVASGLVGITTGYPELDRMTLGWGPGQLVVVAGRPGMGKTALACCMARAAAEAGAPGAIFSLEMGRDELAARMACAETGIPFWRIRSGHMASGERAMVLRAVQKLSRLRLLLNDSPHLTTARLASLVRRAQRDYGAAFAVIDYLGLMASSDGPKAETRNLEVAEISRALKVLSKELSIPIIALHQLNRGSEKRSDPRPMLSDLRDSGAIEQDADVVLLIYRDGADGRPPKDGEAPSTEAELIVAKQRNGMTGTVRVRQRLEAFRFDSLSEQPVQEWISYGGENVDSRN